jgi:enamine deaminase RidA (YjgF/YER057c/UK114 family)
MLYDKDIEAYVAEDWGAVADDFDEAAFAGLVKRGNEPLTIAFAALEDYRADWLDGARTLLKGTTPEVLAAELRAASRIADISFAGPWALVRKEFDGIVGADKVPLRWTTNYHCRRDSDRWRITGFTALFPPAGSSPQTPGAHVSTKYIPEGATQHPTAGPYSPVLVVPAGDTVVISGQGPILPDGTVSGETIEEQTELTLQNCAKQLAVAGCTLDDVFKVNVYLADLDEWGQFNEVYKQHFQHPFPVRTTAGAALLLGMRIEIEMQARRPG